MVQLAVTALVIIIPKEGVRHRLVHLITCFTVGIGQVGHNSFVLRLFRDTCKLTQPVLMTNLCSMFVILTLITATEEVGDLTLLVGGHQLGRERQADALPAFRTIHELIVFRLTLVPHAHVRGEGIGDRRIEVLLVNQEVVTSGNAVLYPVTMQVAGALVGHSAITVTALFIVRLFEVFTHDIGRLLGGCRCLV